MTTESAATLLNQLIQNRFLVVKLIGKGSFGFVFEGYDNDKQKSIAIKFEDRRSSYAQLKNEYRVWTPLDLTLLFRHLQFHLFAGV